MVGNLNKFMQEFAMAVRPVNFVAQLVQGGFGRFHQLGGAEPDQGRFIRRG